jgi:uncharacterized membrane-anchored protein
MTVGRYPATWPAAPPRRAVSKVPLVTAFFWIIKVLTTFMGEATSDYLVHTINPYLAVALGFVVFAVALTAQFAARSYLPWVYWTTVAMVAVFGTMAADVMHVAMGVPYAASTAFFAVTLAVIFAVWYRVEGTLSIHSIRTHRREVFYWAAVVTAFALGTASGDLTATTAGLGYFGSGMLFTAVIVAPAVAYRWFGLNAVASFWFAYIVTRPVGASFADWMGFPPSAGGLGYGHGPVSLVSTILLAGFIGYLSVTGRDVPGAPPAWPAVHRDMAAVMPPSARYGPGQPTSGQAAGRQPVSRQPTRPVGRHRAPR